MYHVTTRDASPFASSRLPALLLALSMTHQTVATGFIFLMALDAVVHGHYQPGCCRRRGKFGLISVALHTVQFRRGDVASVREVHVGSGHSHTLPGYVCALVDKREQSLLFWMAVFFFLIDVMTVEADILTGQPGMGSGFGVSVAIYALHAGLGQVKSVIERDRLHNSFSASDNCIADGYCANRDYQSDDYRDNKSHFTKSLP
jgi:hypothetical protein